MVASDLKSRKRSASAEKRPAASAASKQRCSASCPDPRCARYLVGWIAAQGDKIRDLNRIDAIPSANLRGADTRNLACADGIKNGGVLRGELERIAVDARKDDTTEELLFRCGSRRKKNISLKTRGV